MTSGAGGPLIRSPGPPPPAYSGGQDPTHANSPHSCSGAVASGPPLLWPRSGPGDSALYSSLLSVRGEELQRKQIWGHQYCRGLLEGLVGRVEGTQAFETIRSYMGALLHVKGGWYSIYFNKHLRCASDLCLPPLGGRAGTGGSAGPGVWRG